MSLRTDKEERARKDMVFFSKSKTRSLTKPKSRVAKKVASKEAKLKAARKAAKANRQRAVAKAAEVANADQIADSFEMSMICTASVCLTL